MDSLDYEVLQTCIRWRELGLSCELVTVLKTWGSSPRPPGAMLAMAQDGQVVGSVSGGCIEDDLIDRVKRDGMLRTHPEIVRYGVSADEAHRFGLPCGGTIELLIEPLQDHSALPALLAQLDRQQLIARCVDLRTGVVSLSQSLPGPEVHIEDHCVTTLHGPRWRLLMIGAGPVTRFLAQMAQALDYQVTVCDPREDYRATWILPNVPVVHAMPDDWVIDMKVDAHCAIVALTHDPKLDDLALMEALKSSAFYVGALGSRSNNLKRRSRLLEFELSAEQVDKLHGPTGLYIGSKTPAEIAVSILAEMTAVKNGVHWPRQHRIVGECNFTSSTCTIATGPWPDVVTHTECA
jgi:xanthine dehydrogenase accessory factor